VEQAQIGRVHVRDHAKRLTRARRLGTLRERKRKSFHKYKRAERGNLHGLYPAPVRALVYLVTQHDDSSDFSLSFPELSSPQASSRGLQRTLDEGADENGQES